MIERVLLNCVLELADSGTWGDEASAKTGMPVLRSSNIQDYKIVRNEVAWRLIPKKDRERKRLETGDILVTASSGSPELIGKCAFFDIPDNGRNYYFSNFTLRLRGNRSKIEPKYLYYWLISNDTTSGLRNLNKPLYLNQEIPLPPLPEQRRIAAILDKADALREKRRQAIAKLDELLKSVFVAMFGDPVTNTKKLLTKPIKDFGEVGTGNTPPRSNVEFYGREIEWIKSDNINTPYHTLTVAEEWLSEKGRKVGRIAPAGSTLVTCIAGSPDCIGNAALADREVAFNQQINAITPNEDTDPYFLYTQILLGCISQIEYLNAPNLLILGS